MQLKLIPIVLAVAVSATLLFGGWFVYRGAAMENPLNQALDGSPGVESYEASLESDRAVFRINLQQHANLREIVREVNHKTAEVAGSRQAVIHISSNTSTELEEWWSRALFAVAQAMETSQYTDIPLSLQQQAGERPHLEVQTEMDDINVYVRLTEGEHAKYIILPRSSARMGVWNNE